MNRTAVGTVHDRRGGVHLPGVRPGRAGQAVGQGLAAGRPGGGDPRGRRLPHLRDPRRLVHRGAHRRPRTIKRVLQRLLASGPPAGRHAAGRQERPRPRPAVRLRLPRLALQPRRREHPRPRAGGLAVRAQRGAHAAEARSRSTPGAAGSGSTWTRIASRCGITSSPPPPCSTRSSWRTCATGGAGGWSSTATGRSPSRRSWRPTTCRTPTRSSCKFGAFLGWARAQGRHSNIGYDAPKGMEENQAKLRHRQRRRRPRVHRARCRTYTWENANTNTTETLVEAALRLVAELPEGTPPDQVLKHWLDSARRDDAARGVIWPTVAPEHVGQERHRLADLPQLPDRPRGQQHAVLQRPALRLRPRQVHLRGGRV